MNEAEGMRDLVETIVMNLVDAKEVVTVKTIPESEGIRFEVHVAESDLGKVIGKQGRTARSIRTVLAGASRKFGKRLAVDFLKTGA